MIVAINKATKPRKSTEGGDLFGSPVEKSATAATPIAKVSVRQSIIKAMSKNTTKKGKRIVD